jgi:8-oxo-dGTP diphosphatase
MQRHVLKSTLIEKSKLFEIRKTQLESENFDIINLSSVAVIVTNSENKYLILRRSLTDEDGPGLWDLPGGGVDETDLISAATRELYEEAGIVADEIHYMDDFNYICNWKGEDKIRFVFAHITDAEPALSFEHEEYKWVTEEEILEYEFFVPALRDKVVEFAKTHINVAK